MASLVNTTVTSAAGSGVALAVTGGNNLVDNILLNLLNQSGSTVFNIRNNGALYGTAGDFSGVLVAGSASTNGGSWLEKNYSGSNKLNVLSSAYSSGNTIIGYGAKGKSGGSGFVATYGNFSGNKSVLEVANNAFYFKTTDSAAQDTIGDDITLNTRLAVDKDSMTFTSSAGAGLIFIQHIAASQLLWVKVREVCILAIILTLSAFGLIQIIKLV
jgi:hypothetical protein